MIKTKLKSLYKVIKTKPIIRHIRWFYHRYKLNCHVSRYNAFWANEEDIKHLNSIWQGKL